MKIDSYNHKEKYLAWKSSINGRIPNVSEENYKIILEYLSDMEHGLNVSVFSKKGCRSYIRLNTIREKMLFFANKFEEIYSLDCMTKINEKQLVLFFLK
jgi:hypothetical protein